MDKTTKQSSYYLHIAIVIALMFFFRFIPAPAPITAYGMQILGIFIGLVYGWSLCSLAWPSILALVALGLSDYGITETVLSAVFGQANLVLMLFGFMIFAPLGKSGLTEYLGNKLLSIKFIQGRPLLMVAVCILGTFLIALTHINGYLLMFFLMSIFLDLFKSLGYEKGDPFIPMFLCCIFIQTSFANMLFPFMPFPMMVFGAAGVTVNTAQYLLFASCFFFFTDVVLIALFKILRLNLKPLYEIDYEEVVKKANQPLTKHQKGLLTMVAIFLALMLAVGLFSAGEGNFMQQILNKVGIYGVSALILAAMLVVKVDDEPLMHHGSFINFPVFYKEKKMTSNKKA